MKDEQVATDHFEHVCGSVAQAQRLFRIFKDSHAAPHPNPRYSKTREEVFEARAKAEGFTPKQVQALYECQ